MQTIFEVTDDYGSVSYLHMGDAPIDDFVEAGRDGTHRLGYFAQSTFRQNKAVSWPSKSLRPSTLFPLFNKMIPAFNSNFENPFENIE